MKRRRFLKHLRDQGCYLLREGRRHSVFVNSRNNRTSTVPRHREIDDFLAGKKGKGNHGDTEAQRKRTV